MPAALVFDRDIAKELFLNGLGIADIAQRTGVKPCTIYQWRKRGQWDTLPRIDHTTKDLAIQETAQRLANQTVRIAEKTMCRIESLAQGSLRDSKDAAIALSSAYSTARKALGLDDVPAGALHLHYHGPRITSEPVTIDLQPSTVSKTVAIDPPTPTTR